MNTYQVPECCQLTRTDSTTLASNARGYTITPGGQERRLQRLTLKVQKRKYLHNLQKNFNLVQKRAAICVAFHNPSLNLDTIKDIADQLQ